MSYIGKKPVDFNDVTEAQTFEVTGDLTVDTNTLHVDSTNNRVGVGTDSPDTIAEIRGANPIVTIRDTETSSASAEATLRLAETGASDSLGSYWDIKSSGGKLEFIDNWDEGGGTGTRVTLDDSGKVGIGTTTPENPIEIETANTLGSTFTGTTHGEGLRVTQSSYSSGNFVSLVEAPYQPNGVPNVRIAAMFDGSGSKLSFGTSNSYGSGITNEAMRIDSDGNLLVKKTVAGSTNIGFEAKATGFIAATRDGATPVIFNRKTSFGGIVTIRKDDTTVGSLGAVSSGFYIDGEANHSGIRFAQSTWIPRKDGADIDDVIDLGTSSVAFDNIFATNQNIQTSDQNEKQQISALTNAEITAAKALSKLFKTFKWNSAVESKGDNARTHTGHIAQEVQSAMTDAGLDAANYAFWCSDTWWETYTEVPAVEADEENGIDAKDAYTRRDVFETAEEAPEGATERTRLGIRYPELLAFIGAATEQRLADIETRLTALEAE